MKTTKQKRVEETMKDLPEYVLAFEVTRTEKHVINLSRDTAAKTIGQFLDDMIHDAMVDNAELDKVTFDLRPLFAAMASDDLPASKTKQEPEPY